MSDWEGCYSEGWKGVIVDEAFSHPAKFANGLIRRIYKHAITNGAIQPGGLVVDPFGGVALGGLYAMQNGLNWVGCELEEKFVELGRQNIALWNARYSAAFPKWGTARLLQGDSRRLAEVVSAAGLVVASPPYADGAARNGGADPAPERMQGGRRGIVVDGYGSTPGQLGAMRPGSVDAVVCSPPFAGNTGGRGEASRNGIDSALFDRHSGGMKKGTGSNPANLDHLPQGNVGAVIGSPLAGLVVASPPYADSINSKNNGIDWTKTKKDYPGRKMHESRIEMAERHHNERRYGQTPGQLGTDSGPTFWTAAAEIVTQCAAILPAGGWTYWVVKDYVKAGQIVPFSDQWRQLCEAYGFETVEVIRAWLVKRNGSQAGLNGEMVSKDVERKSFFRRLAEKKGAPRIDWETVLIMRASL